MKVFNGHIGFREGGHWASVSRQDSACGVEGVGSPQCRYVYGKDLFIINFQNNTSTGKMYLKFFGLRDYVQVKNGIHLTQIDITDSIKNDEWIGIEVHVKVGNGTGNRKWQIWGYSEDGTLLGTQTYTDEDTCGTYCQSDGHKANRVMLGGNAADGEAANWSANSDHVYFDDLIFDDAQIAPTYFTLLGGGSAPTVSSTTVSPDGTEVTIVFSETVVTTSYDQTDGFNLDCSVVGNDILLEDISSDTGSTRTFTADTTINSNDTCTIDYTGGADEIEDASGNDLAAFSGSNGSTDTVNNTSTQDDQNPTPDPATWATAPDGDSTSQISMIATTGADANTISYSFVNDNTDCGDSAGTGGTSSGWQSDDATYVNSGLQVNKCYGYTIQMRDTIPNTGTASATAEAYTSANVPGAPTLNAATTSSLDITNDENSNPSADPTTKFAAYCTSTSPADTTWFEKYTDASGDPSGTAVWLTDAQLNELTINNLENSTTYGWKVKARNEDSDETEWSSEGQGTTTSVSVVQGISF
jgi:hypothetical protein